MHEYDAIIAGASFAGLAAADRLEGDILLIDHKEIGTNQTSACATFSSVLEELGCKGAILQEFDKLTMHIPEERIIDLIEPIATFDYGKFCKLLIQRSVAKTIKTPVKGVAGKSVITDEENFSSQCIIDCTGWRAVLASSLKSDYVDRNKLAFGIETEVCYPHDTMHLFVDPKIIQQGAAWIFPAGRKTRIGVTSYAGRTDILPELSRFLGTYGLEVSEIHGGYIPFGLRAPVVENLFLVGDSSGMAPPATSEGIRPALYFGRQCALTVQNIIEGNKTLKEGLIEYRNVVDKSINRYMWLQNIQNPLLNNLVPGTIKKAACNKIFSKIFQKMYLGV